MDLFNELRKMNILLIDDDQWIRDSLRLFFESENCMLDVAETAEEGLEALGDKDFDIIIIDYCLPGMDGLDFLKKIRNTQTSAIKILITAYANKQIMEEASRIGVHYFIAKPFTSNTVESVLSQLIEARKRLISDF
jgi:two-component system response regulator (stage 0 sporulation protein F)